MGKQKIIIKRSFYISRYLSFARATLIALGAFKPRTQILAGKGDTYNVYAFLNGYSGFAANWTRIKVGIGIYGGNLYNSVGCEIYLRRVYAICLR